MPRAIHKTLIAMAAIVALSSCTGSADRAGGRGFQQATILQIAQLNDVAPPQVQAYAAAVKEQSHGSLRLEFKDSWHKGEVDFEKHTLDDVTTGRVQGAWVGVPSLDLIGVTSFQPLLAPLLVDSQVVQSRVFTSGIPAGMAQGLQGHGLVGVAVLPGPMRKVLGVRQPYREPADFRKATLGIQGGAIPEATAKALGATFTRMSSGASLTQVDAFEQHVGNIVGSFYGLEAKYLTANVNLWPQAMAVVLNETSYRALTDSQREILHRAAISAIPAALKATQLEDDSGVMTLCAQGVTFPSASDVQLAALRRAVHPVYDEIAQDPANARMLDRLIDLRAALGAGPDVSACPSAAARPGGGSFPAGTYGMVLDNDLRAQCVDTAPQGTRGQKSWYVLEIAGNRVTIRQRIDSQNASWGVAYNGVYSALRDRVRIDDLTATWSYDGTALRLTDMTGGSCDTTVLWTAQPWVLRAGPAQGRGGVPDGTYESGLTDADRRLCDGQATLHSLNHQRGTGGKPTLYASITLDAGAISGVTHEGSLAAMPRLAWLASYVVHGSTFELTKLELMQAGGNGISRWNDLTATFTFDGTTLTLTPVGSWPCWVQVAWTLHPWTLTKKAP